MAWTAGANCSDGAARLPPEPHASADHGPSSETSQNSGEMHDICEHLAAICEADLLPTPHVLETSDPSARMSTVGLMLHEVEGSIIVDNVVAGLPAFKSRKIDRGDVIVRVDDQVSCTACKHVFGDKALTWDSHHVCAGRICIQLSESLNGQRYSRKSS